VAAGTTVRFEVSTEGRPGGLGLEAAEKEVPGGAG